MGWDLLESCWIFDGLLLCMCRFSLEFDWFLFVILLDFVGMRMFPQYAFGPRAIVLNYYHPPFHKEVGHWLN